MIKQDYSELTDSYRQGYEKNKISGLLIEDSYFV